MKYIKISDKIKLFVDERNDRKKFNLELIYSRGGSLYEKDGQKGRRHLMEHCIVSETSSMDLDGVKAFCLENNVMLNAWTDNKNIALIGESHVNNFSKVFDMYLEFFVSPTFTQKTLDREKSIVLKEIIDRTGEPSYQLMRYMCKQIFTEDSEFNNEVLGEVEDVSSTTLGDMQDDFDRMLEESELLVFISGGGIDLDFVTGKLEKISGDLGGSFTSVVEAKNVFKKPSAPEAVINDLAHSDTELNIHIPFDITIDNLACRSIFLELFFSYNGGAVYNILREEKGLIYGYHAGFYKSVEGLDMEMNCSLGDVKDIVDSVEEVFSNFEKYFSTKKFETIKNASVEKNEIMSDKIDFEKNFVKKGWSNFGVFLPLDKYIASLDKVSEDDIRKMYTDFRKKFDDKKVVLVSKDKKAEEVVTNI